MEILKLHSVIIKYLLLNNKNPRDLGDGYISKEHSKFSIAYIETKHVLGLLEKCVFTLNKVN